MIYGYARVSSPGDRQDHAAQVAELTAAGCERIFAEKVSAAHGRRRPEFAKVVAKLEPGDVLVVTRLNRFARSALDALNTIAAVKDRGAEFRSLRETWADTTTPVGRLMTTIAAGFAEYDREMIIERTGEGRTQAKARGVRFGRPRTLTWEQEAFVVTERAKVPPRPLSELQKLLGVSRATICRVAARGVAEDAKAPPTPLGAHLASCAILAAGAGADRRCTCGGRLHQVDLEELTGDRPPPSPIKA